MKKVGIITIESENWGNRLQNYALQRIIESFGFQVETINRHYNKKISVRLQEKIKKIIKIIIGAKSKKIYEFDKLINKSKHYARKDEAEGVLDSTLMLG